MSLNYYVENAFCVFEENQHVNCSSGLPFKVFACGILDSLGSGWDSEFSCVTEHHCKIVNCKVANIYFSNLSKILVIHSVITKLKLSKAVNAKNYECWNLLF